MATDYPVQFDTPKPWAEYRWTKADGVWTREAVA